MGATARAGLGWATAATALPAFELTAATASGAGLAIAGAASAPLRRAGPDAEEGTTLSDAAAGLPCPDTPNSRAGVLMPAPARTIANTAIPAARTRKRNTSIPPKTRAPAPSQYWHESSDGPRAGETGMTENEYTMTHSSSPLSRNHL